MNCEWTINGKTFNTLEDLDRYIKTNHPDYLKLGGVKFNFEDIIKNVQLDSKSIKSKNKSGVLDYISKIPNFIQGFDAVAFEEAFRKTLHDEKGGFSDLINREVDEAWKAKQEEIKRSRELGKGVHLLIEDLLIGLRNKKYWTSGELDELYNKTISKTTSNISETNKKITEGTLNPPLDGISPSLQGFNGNNLKSVLDNFTSTIYKPIVDKADGNNIWIRTEQALEEKLGEEFSKNPEIDVNIDTIKGKIDVLIIYKDKVTNKTKAEIIDIKTSNNFSDNWDVDRLNTVDVQLDVYKRLLAKKGIYESDINTKSLVIKLNTKDINNVIVEGKLDAKTTFLDHEKHRIVNKMIPLEEKILPEDEKFIENVKSDISKFFNIDPETSELEETLKRNIAARIQEIPVGNEKKYKAFYINDKNIHKEEIFNSKIEAEKFVKNKIIESNNKGRNIDYLTKIIEDGLNKGNVTGLFKNYNDESNYCWERNLQKYVSVDGWRVETSSVYSQLQVLVFVNDLTKEVDIIKVSRNLDSIVPISGRKNILGKFMTDAAAKTKRDDFMPSKNGNIELIKILTIANRLNLPTDYTLGEIKVLDPKVNRGTCSMVTTKLLANFEALCYNAGIDKTELKFKDKFIQALDLIKYSNKSLGNTSIYNILKDRVDSFYNEKETARQLEDLGEIIKEIELVHNDYKLDMQNSFDSSFSGFVYREVMGKIAVLSNRALDVSNSRKLTSYGLTWDTNILNGLNISSLDSIKILQPISNLKTATDTKIRWRYTTNYKNTDNKITKPYIDYAKSQSAGHSLVANPIINLETVIYNKFYDRTETGDLVLINPDDPSKNGELTEKDKEYLRYWLEDMNKHRILASGDKTTVDELKASGIYWRVPLMKSKSGSRLAQGKVKAKDIKAGIALDYDMQLQNDNNETNISTEGYDPSKVESFEMQNSIALSDSEIIRSRLLENVDPYINFETNLEAVKDQYVNSYIIQQEWNKQMVVLNSVMVSLKLTNYLYGESTDTLITFLNDYINSSIKGRNIMDEEFRNPAKVFSVAKSFVTVATLGLNWKSGFKEFVMSNYTLYKNAVVNSRLDKDRLNFSDVNYATKYIWGDLYQQSNPDNITMAQGLNFLYGMVNNTIFETADKQNFNATSIFKWSNRMMSPNRFPDFTGRMTLLVGYLHKIGALDAHSIENNYDVVYDWTKDDRFKLYAKDKTGKTISESEKEEWARQKGNYVSRMLQLRENGFQIPDKETGELRNIKLEDDLPIAFTTEEISAIQQESDTMFGYMDPDRKSIIFKKSQGLLFGHFSTFITAKKNQLVLTNDKNGQGKWKQITDANTGQLMYRKEIYDTEGNIIDYEATTEVTDTPLYGWNGTITEGMIWSLVDLFNVTKMENLKEAWKDPYKRKNALIALEDLLAFLLLLIVGNLLFGDRKNAKGAEKIAANIMFNSAQDINGFQAILGVAQFKVPTFDFVTNLGDDVRKLLLGDIDMGYLIGNRFSVSRDFISK